MSLMETDTQNIDRSSPSFDAPDLVGVRMAHGTTGFTLVSDGSGDIAKVVIRDGRISTFKSDGSLISVTGIRSSDGEAAVETAKPGLTL